MSILLSLTLLAADAAAPAPPPAKPNQNEEVCKRLGAPTGSRLGERRVCKSRAQWEEERLAAKQALERAQTQRGYRAD